MFATLLGVWSTSLLTNHSQPLTSTFNAFRAFAHRYGNLRWVDRKPERLRMHVRFTPKADMREPPRYVCFVPKGDICIAADLFDHLVGECEQLVGNIEAEFLKLARMDDVRRSRVLDHAAARNSARQRAPDRGAVRVAFACGGRARPIPKPLRIAMKAKAGPSGY